MGFGALSGVIFDVLRGASWALTLSFPFVGDALAACFTFMDRQVGQRAFSRKLEIEADTCGLELMARAGFDPRAALELWEILNEVEADVTTKGQHGGITDHIALLRTHPTGEQRLAVSGLVLGQQPYSGARLTMAWVPGADTRASPAAGDQDLRADPGRAQGVQGGREGPAEAEGPRGDGGSGQEREWGGRACGRLSWGG